MFAFASLAQVLCLLFIVDCTSSDGLIYRTNGRRSRAPAAVSDLDKRTPDFIEKFGYIAETYEVTTEDGYINTLHRIVRKDTQGTPKNRPVVLIQHGISGSSDNWLLNGPTSLPLMMSDAGYDVWLADSRGNSYSNKHVNLTTANPRFWDFSFADQGYYDLAASIDFALATTDQAKLFLMGHSRGTTMMFVLLSRRPEYNSKITLALCFAPVAYLKHSKSPALKAIFENSSSKEIVRILKSAGLFALPGKKSSVPYRRMFCSQGAPTQILCSRALFLFNGFDPDLMDLARLPVFVSHFPDGGGMKEFVHYMQIAKSDIFRDFDYGKISNLKKYGQPQPPTYNLSKITAPMSIHYADNDFFVSIQDLNHLTPQLPNIIGMFRVPFPKFNHIDFLWGSTADRLLYKPTIKFMNTFL